MDSGELEGFARRMGFNGFQALVAAYTDMVYSAAVRLVRDPGLAEDVAQGVFIVLVRKAPELRPETHLGAWLLQVTRYTASAARRGRARREFHERRSARMRDEVGAALEVDDGPGESALVRGALRRLSEADRRAVMLRYFEGKDLRSVGAALGISSDAAEKRVSRAVDRMRRDLVGRGVAA